MKRFIILIMLLLFNGLEAKAQFVEKFRSQPERKWPFANLRSDIFILNLLKDFDRDGGLDILAADETSGNLICYSGKTKQELWLIPISALPGASLDSVVFWGFIDGGDGTIYGLDVWEHAYYLINTQNNSAVFDMRNVQVLGVANVDQDPLLEIIAFDHTAREIVVVGWQGSGIALKGTGDHSMPGNALRSRADYQLKLKFKSDPGQRLAYDSEQFESSNDLDLDGDNTMDLAMLVENNNNSVGLIVRDGTSHTIKWQFTFPQEHLEDLLHGFHGFFDANGNGEKEAIFGHRTVVTLDGVVHTLDPNFEILAIFDVDNDGYADLVGRGFPDSTVQVWGAASPTGVTEKDLIIAGFQLHQNYPNPFNPSTAISFQLPVNSEVNLTIYNSLGQLVRTIANRMYAKGSHSVVWDGRDDFGRRVASGSYFYQLNAGDFQSMKGMLLLK